MTPPPAEPAANGHIAPAQRHRRGKIARLPKVVRDQVNQMLRDGSSYQHILDALRSRPETAALQLSKQNISRWKAAGYQDWLARQEWREELTERHADSLQLLDNAHESRFQEVSLHVAAMRIFELLQRLEASTLSPSLQDLPPGFLRLLAVLPRISREALRYQKYRDACLQARAEVRKLKDPKRKLSNDERRAIVRNLDEILGLPSEPDPASPPPPENPSIHPSNDS